MAAISHAAPARTNAKPLLPIAGWLASFDDWRRVRAAEAELMNLSDSALDDLGIRRSEISHVVRNGRR